MERSEAMFDVVCIGRCHVLDRFKSDINCSSKIIMAIMEDTKPDQIVLQPKENQESEQQQSMSEDEEPEENDDEELENENDKENREINDNDISNPYSSVLTTMEWSLPAHPDYHKIIGLGTAEPQAIWLVMPKICLQKLQSKAALML